MRKGPRLSLGALKNQGTEHAIDSTMAKANIFNLVLLLCLLLLISMAEGRLFDFGFGAGKTDSTPECDSVYGVEGGDTCFGVAKVFNLTTELFNGFNPNLNCDTLFAGQWLCVAGDDN